jgi:hypothetical protein
VSYFYVQDSSKHSTNYLYCKAHHVGPKMRLDKLNKGSLMIIFVITFAIVALFAMTLTGSIATTSRRRS